MGNLNLQAWQLPADGDPKNTVWLIDVGVAQLVVTRSTWFEDVGHSLSEQIDWTFAKRGLDWKGDWVETAIEYPVGVAMLAGMGPLFDPHSNSFYELR